MDIAPTILDVLGIRIPGQFRGQSLVDTLRTHEDRDSFTEATLYGQNRIAYRTSKEKIIFNVNDKTYEVYDIEKDPFERNKIEGRVELQQILQTFIAEKTQESERKLIDAKMERQLRSLGYIRLSEAKLLKIYQDSVRAGNRAEKQAEKQIPTGPKSTLDDFTRQSELREKLEEKYKRKVAKKHGLTMEELKEISSEGLLKNWALPRM